MKHTDRQVETLATFVHGSLSTLHALGLVYNLNRRQWKHAAIHALVMVYDFTATLHHSRL